MKIFKKNGVLTIEMLRPSDGHGHLREGPLMALIIWAFSLYLYVVCMGNTKRPISDDTDVNRYKQELKTHKPRFIPVQTIMLNEKMLLTNSKANKPLLERIHNSGVKIIKFIPAGTSTNAVIKITLPQLKEYFPVLDFWASLPGTIFSIHLELINSGDDTIIPEIERETAALPFGEELVDRYGGSSLIITFEHASTAGLINLVKRAAKKLKNIYASLTTQHATITYDMVRDPKTGEIRNPNLYCMPIAKTAEDVKAVREAMTGIYACFYLGTDCAAHYQEDKQGEKPNPGNFTPGPIALPQLCQIFEEEGKLGDALEYFASVAFLNLTGQKHTGQTITIQKESWPVPKEYNGIVPSMAGQTLFWKVKI